MFKKENREDDLLFSATQHGNVMLSKEEFYEREEVRPLIKQVNSSAYLCFFAAFCTFVLIIISAKISDPGSGNVADLISMVNWFSLIDVAILIIMGLLIKIKKSFAAAIILLLYAALNVGISVYETGTPGGWLILFAAVIALINIRKLQKAWNDYQATGALPDIPAKKKK